MIDNTADVIATSSLLLAVAAAVMTFWYADVNKAIDEKEPDLPAERRTLGKRIAPVFWSKALPLAVGATAISSVFLPRTVGIAIDALSAIGKARSYDDIKAACAMTEGLMLALAAFTIRLAWLLGAKRLRLR